MAKILVIEDDTDLSDRITAWLTGQSYQVERASTGEEGFDLLRFYHYDIGIIDWQLPGLSGPEIIRRFRNEGGKTPILMLTGKSDVREKSHGLDAGADDYLTKPFSFEELSARVRALLRRLPTYQHEEMNAGELIVDRTKHSVSYRGEEIHLLPKEFEILELLLRQRDMVISQESILERVWSSQSETTTASVRTYMKTLRKKLSRVECVRITTVHGYGYRLKVTE
ncbi:MAG: response regulator transcription factor [Candidatus Obscuribacterales bacterium]|nr:response regulator transcription factor [Candidatus Obscuribacterales bacterium]